MSPSSDSKSLPTVGFKVRLTVAVVVSCVVQVVLVAWVRPPATWNGGVFGALALAFACMVPLAVWAMAGFRSIMADLNSRAYAMARGDLTGQLLRLEGMAEFTQLGSSYNLMQQSLNELVGEVSSASVRVNAAAQQIYASTTEQDRGASRQSSAIEQTQRSLDGLMASSQRVGTMAGSVLQSAQTSLESNQGIGDRITELSRQTDRIAEVLEVIKDIANKSEILALNAALEGARAGEVGRGFSLVGTRMQALAEDVMKSVGSIRILTEDVRASTRATVDAVDQAMLAAATMTESAQQIDLIVRQQIGATEQVTMAMTELKDAASQNLEATRENVEAARALSTISDRLEALLAGFRTTRAGHAG